MIALAPSLASLLKKLGVSVYYPKYSLKFFTDVILKVIEERESINDVSGRTRESSNGVSVEQGRVTMM